MLQGTNWVRATSFLVIIISEGRRKKPGRKPKVKRRSFKDYQTDMGEGSGAPLQYSCLDGGAWWAAVHGVAESRTGLSNFTFTFHFHALEKEMATYSSVLFRDGGAWWAAVYGVTQSQTWLKRLSSSSKQTWVGPLSSVSTDPNQRSNIFSNPVINVCVCILRGTWSTWLSAPWGQGHVLFPLHPQQPMFNT